MSAEWLAWLLYGLGTFIAYLAFVRSTRRRMTLVAAICAWPLVAAVALVYVFALWMVETFDDS